MFSFYLYWKALGGNGPRVARGPIPQGTHISESRSWCSSIAFETVSKVGALAFREGLPRKFESSSCGFCLCPTLTPGTRCSL